MDRPSLDQVMMQTARTWAVRSTCSRLSVGAVLARDGRVLSTGYNGAPRGMAHCDHEFEPQSTPCATSVHAEANAIASAAYHGVSTCGAILYCTHSPCLACAALAINAGVIEVFFAEMFRDPSGLELLARAAVLVRRVG